nr:hypothetical protein Iba_chr01fCG6150 [Ipomoea batatas]GMD16565.1 hypothetical protein Iba_chr07cCG10650 [Ipomoea batatas]GMD63351.1 hypothetical protein Iba_chr12bCG13990 [Ipomoea batatas]
MLCLATAHHPADAKDTETTVVQSLASTLAHSVVGRRSSPTRLVASCELPVSRSPSSSSVISVVWQPCYCSLNCESRIELCQGVDMINAERK